MADNPHQTQRLATPPACGVQPGDLLGQRFQLINLLGWGGQAVVFRALDQSTGERIAVKVVRTDLPAPAYQDALRVLRLEARLLQRIEHPALPHLIRFEHDPASGRTWLAREVIEGVPLAEWTSQGTHRLASPRSPDVVRDWAIQISQMLRYLHSLKPPVICGDLKPANLIRRIDGTLALIDLGAAQTLTLHPPQQARPRFGTPGYAPPEQLGGREMDERADVFSLGVVCYELLTGIDPTLAPLQFDWLALTNAAPTLADAMRWALHPDPEQRAPTVAAWLATITDVDPPEPLSVGFGVQLRSYTDLTKIARQHPRLIEASIEQRTLDAWLAQQPDPQLAMLLHRLRAARRTAKPQQRALDTFYAALVPLNNAVALRVIPEQLELGAVPLRHWRIWSKPRQLTLLNPAPHPIRYEVVCVPNRGSDLRLIQDDKRRRSATGIIPPGGSAVLGVVANATKGQHRGTLQVTSGGQQVQVGYTLEGVAGVPIGQQFVRSLDMLSLSQPGVVADLEALLERGVLARWLRAQGNKQQAAMVERASRSGGQSPLQRRLLIAALLHPLSPQRYPRLVLHGADQRRLDVIAGERVRFIYEIENTGEYACSVTFVSSNPLLQVEQTGLVVPPMSVKEHPVVIIPPPQHPPGPHDLSFELWSGDLVLPVTLPVRVLARHWWQRWARWLFGE